jgi:Protein of unknown function (DUF1361)
MTSERSNRPLFWLTVSLAACSAMAIGLLLVRNRATSSISHRFLVWNLALAWIPLGAALLAHRWADRRLRLVAAGVIWLIFFPNSPYLVTARGVVASSSPAVRRSIRQRACRGDVDRVLRLSPDRVLGQLRAGGRPSTSTRAGRIVNRLG